MEKNGKIHVTRTFLRRTYANPGSLNSYRAEAAGASHLIVDENIVPSTYHGDNISVVNAISSPVPLKPLCPEWDVLEPTRIKVQEHSIQCKHVKGYQDRKKKF